MAGMETIEREQGTVHSRGATRVNPLAILKMMPNEAAAMVSMRFGLFGPSYALSSACATGAQVIGEAARTIRSGAADVMVAGGCDAAITPLWIGAFARMGAISRRNDDPAGASRPFDAARDGFVFAEGAGALILESREHAENRGAEILAEVAGYGVSNDANHLAQPHPEGAGAAQAMRFAMEDARVTPADVDYINAHGTGTAMNDRAETIAIKNALGTESKRIPTSSTKSQIGHTMGAAGVIEAAATILSMRNSVIPATINLTDPDPDCDLDYVADGPREAKIRVALSNSFGLGGHNACIALKTP
jgi:3-oxoacyl-[acyl-carrier-protein] synthase II